MLNCCHWGDTELNWPSMMMLMVTQRQRYNQWTTTCEETKWTNESTRSSRTIPIPIGQRSRRRLGNVCVAAKGQGNWRKAAWVQLMLDQLPEESRSVIERNLFNPRQSLLLLRQLPGKEFHLEAISLDWMAWPSVALAKIIFHFTAFCDCPLPRL